jgi:hypothetical protein
MPKIHVYMTSIFAGPSENRQTSRLYVSAQVVFWMTQVFKFFQRVQYSTVHLQNTKYSSEEIHETQEIHYLR